MIGLEFPFPYREGQRELVHGVYRTILREKQLFIQAPTGVGKTMSCLYPAVRSVGEGISERIFYLTAKTITRTVAGEAFEILKKHGPVSYTHLDVYKRQELYRGMDPFLDHLWHLRTVLDVSAGIPTGSGR